MLGIRLFLIGILASAVVGAGVYVMKLRSDNAILKANAVKMEEAISDQQELITPVSYTHLTLPTIYSV